MPLTSKGKKIKKAMEEHYGKEKGDQVFYASENKGNIKGVAKDGKSSDTKTSRSSKSSSSKSSSVKKSSTTKKKSTTKTSSKK